MGLYFRFTGVRKMPCFLRDLHGKTRGYSISIRLPQIYNIYFLTDKHILDTNSFFPFNFICLNTKYIFICIYIYIYISSEYCVYDKHEDDYLHNFVARKIIYISRVMIRALTSSIVLRIIKVRRVPVKKLTATLLSFASCFYSVLSLYYWF